MRNRPEVLVIVGSAQAGYAAEFARENGYRAAILTRRMTNEIVRMADIPIEINSFEQAGKVLDRLRCLPVRGVVSLDQHSVTLASRIGKGLGLRGVPSLDAAEVCEDKRRFAERLRLCGVPHPETRLATTEDEAECAARGLGGNVVVKPANDSGSRGVRIVETPRGAREAFRVIRQQGVNSIGNPLAAYALIQEAVEGPEFSVEVAVENGSPRVLMLTAKRVVPPPFCIESGHVVPAPLSHDDNLNLSRTAVRAVKAVGLDFAVAHVEIKLDPRRGPVVIELGARPAGDRISELVALVSGFDLRAAACQIALGQPVAPVQNAMARSAAIHYLFAEDDGVLVCPGFAQASRVPGVVDVLIRFPIGSHVVRTINNAGRLGNVIAVGDTPEEAVYRADVAANTLSLVVRTATRAPEVLDV